MANNGRQVADNLSDNKPKLGKQRPKLGKPKDFQHGQHQLACVSEGFYCEEDDVHLPDAIFIHCEELTAKKTRKLAKWLLDAANFVERSTRKKGK